MAINLLIVRGLPGSGKTTFSEHLIRQGAYDVLVEADQYFMIDGRYVFDKALLSAAHSWCQSTVEEYLRKGKRVIVANTFTRLWEVSFYLNLATDTYKCPVSIVTTEGSYGSIHGVTEEAIVSMRKRWERTRSR